MTADAGIEHRKGPLGGQLYEHRISVPADADLSGAAMCESIEFALSGFRALARHLGQRLSFPIFAREDTDDQAVYLVSAEGLTKEN